MNDNTTESKILAIILKNGDNNDKNKLTKLLQSLYLREISEYTRKPYLNEAKSVAGIYGTVKSIRNPRSNIINPVPHLYDQITKKGFGYPKNNKDRISKEEFNKELRKIFDESDLLKNNNNINSLYDQLKESKSGGYKTRKNKKRKGKTRKH